jgi:hypothetical protein
LIIQLYWNLQLGKTRFHKSQALDYKEDLKVVDQSKPGIGGKLLLGQSPNRNSSVYPKGLGGDKPAWVAFDKQVNVGDLSCNGRWVKMPVSLPGYNH